MADGGRLHVGSGGILGLLLQSPALLLSEAEFPAAKDARAARKFGHECLFEAFVQRSVQNRVKNGRGKAGDESEGVPESERKERKIY